MLLQLPMERPKNNRDPRAPSSASALAECNRRRVFISKRPWIANDGFSCCPSASIPAGLGLAGGLRARCRARFEPHAGQRQILRFFPHGSAVGGYSGCTRPVAAGNGAPIRRSAVRRETLSAEAESSIATRRPVLAETKITALWELRTSFGPRGSPPNRSQSCPPKFGPIFFDVWSLPRRRVRAVGGADLRLHSVAQARRAPFDNPSRSWNMTSARSLDYARG